MQNKFSLIEFYRPIFPKPKSLGKILIHEIQDDEMIFNFNEFESIGIKVTGEDYTVSIDCAAYLEDDKVVKTEETTLTLEHDKTYTISLNGNFDLGYNPGIYNICFKHKNGNVINACFEVTTNSDVPEESFISLREKIEDFISGLSLDLGKTAIAPDSDADLSSKQYLFKAFCDFSKDFNRACCNIEKELDTKLENKIVKTENSAKQNQTSIKKSIQKGTSYGVKKQENLNKTAGVLKQYLIRIEKKLKLIKEPFEANINRLLKEIEYLEGEVVKKTNDLNNEYLSENKIKGINNRINALNSLIKGKKNSLDITREHFEAYKIIKNSMTKLLSIKSMKKAEAKITGDTTLFTTNTNFKFIKEFTNLIEGKESKLRDGFEYYDKKKSSELFEIYGLILICQALKEIGYESSVDLNSLTNIESNDSFIFTRDNKTIKVIYDNYAKNYKEADIDDVVSINSRNNKPDYTLVYYEDDVFKDIVIVEMKYRSLAKIFNSFKSDCELDFTINDYFQLAYKETNETYPIRGVSKVLLLYPSQREAEFVRSFAHIISFNPSIDEEESESFKLLTQLLDN